MGNQPRKKLKAQKRATVQKETRAPRKAEVTKKGGARKKLLQLKVEKARKKEKAQKTLPPPERIQHQQAPKAKF